MKTLLVVLGAPLWFPLLIAALAVIFSVIVSLWAVVISLWAAFVSTVIAAPAGIAIGTLNIISGSIIYGSVIIALSIVSGIVSFVLLYISTVCTKGVRALTVKTWEAITSIRF